MKSMQSVSSAIFFLTYFTRTERMANCLYRIIKPLNYAICLDKMKAASSTEIERWKIIKVVSWTRLLWHRVLRLPNEIWRVCPTTRKCTGLQTTDMASFLWINLQRKINPATLDLLLNLLKGYTVEIRKATFDISSLFRLYFLHSMGIIRFILIRLI